MHRFGLTLLTAFLVSAAAPPVTAQTADGAASPPTVTAPQDPRQRRTNAAAFSGKTAAGTTARAPVTGTAQPHPASAAAGPAAQSAHTRAPTRRRDRVSLRHAELRSDKLAPNDVLTNLQAWYLANPAAPELPCPGGKGKLADVALEGIHTFEPVLLFPEGLRKTTRVAFLKGTIYFIGFYSDQSDCAGQVHRGTVEVERLISDTALGLGAWYVPQWRRSFIKG